MGGFMCWAAMSSSGRHNDVWSWAEGESVWKEEKANNDNFWSKRSEFQALSHDGLLYVMGGTDGNKNDVWSSADGVSWTKVADANWAGRESFGCSHILAESGVVRKQRNDYFDCEGGGGRTPHGHCPIWR